MFNTGILDTAIGIVFLFALLALINSALVELILAVFNLRGKKLLDAIQNLLPEGAKSLLSAEDLRKHGAIATLSPGGLVPGAPSYIPPALFGDVAARLLLDTEAVQHARDAATNELEALKATLVAHPTPANDLLLLALDRAQRTAGTAAEQLNVFRTELARLYDETMERAQGWLKRRVQLISLGLSLGLCLLVNADCIQLARTLSQDPVARARLANMAIEYSQQLQAENATSPTGNCTKILEQFQQQTNAGQKPAPECVDQVIDCTKQAITAHTQTVMTAFPLGWGDKVTAMAILQALPGILLSTIAVSLGASFWFKLLEQVIRLTGKRIPLESETPKKATP